MSTLLEQLKEIRGQKADEQQLNQTIVTWREFTPVLDAVIELTESEGAGVDSTPVKGTGRTKTPPSKGKK